MSKKTCLTCETEHANPRFCSKSCAAKFNNKRRFMSDESRGKIRQSVLSTLHLRKSRKGEKRERHLFPRTAIKRKNCTCCKREFWSTRTYNSHKITCSPECARKNQTYRKIVTEYFHDGETLLLESSWELKIAEWLDKIKLNWTRPNHIKWVDSKGKERKYFPDFYILNYDLYLDPKNTYQINVQKEKLLIVSNKVNLVYGNVEYIKNYVLAWGHGIEP